MSASPGHATCSAKPSCSPSPVDSHSHTVSGVVPAHLATVAATIEAIWPCVPMTAKVANLLTEANGMAWMQQRDALTMLGVSQRTLSRRISKGELETKRDGTSVLVWIDEESPVDPVAKIGGQLAKVAAADAIKHSRDMDIVAATVDALGHATERAAETERRAHNTIRASVCMAATVAIAAIVGVGWGGMKYHESTLENQQTVFSLKTDHASDVANMAAKVANVTQRLATAQDQVSTAEAGRVDAVRLSAKHLAAFEAERDANARRRLALRVLDGFAALRGALTFALTNSPGPTPPDTDQVADAGE